MQWIRREQRLSLITEIGVKDDLAIDLVIETFKAAVKRWLFLNHSRQKDLRKRYERKRLRLLPGLKIL
jgi:hypothetical protein